MTRERGVTLLEVLVAVTLLSVLSLGILMAMRGGLDSLDRTNRRLNDNRRVTGARRALDQQLRGFMPVIGACMASPDAPPMQFPFFQGDPQTMRFVSSYSLQESSRGYPRILEFQVIPGADSRGVRLVVNEHLYTGPLSAGRFCLGQVPDPETGAVLPTFAPVEIGPGSFVLADRLAYCWFSYEELAPQPPPQLPAAMWRNRWISDRWPRAIRVEMAPLDDPGGKLAPFTLTAPLPVNRIPIFRYADL
ncbi:MAG: prepilin-type N-terminal cleavage/methylation domain-containing protein [Bryobacterales bacterium]|nr:prepilin-type N-terminal cleavage/methylation domain-containing protein [Bryobacterales bacterium]